MGLIDAFVLVGLFFVGLPLAGAVGWLMRTVFRTRRFSALPLLIVLATIVAGAPLALRIAGVQTDARVVGRDERVRVNPRDGGWASEPRLHVLTVEVADPGRAASFLTLQGVVFHRTAEGALVPPEGAHGVALELVG